MEAIENGVITQERIDESVRRILRTKMKYCMFETRFRDPKKAGQKLNTEDQIKASEDVFQQVITLVKNENNLWPLSLGAGQKIHVVSIGPYQSEMYSDAFWGNISSTSLLWEVRKLYPTATGDHYDVMPCGLACTRLLNRAEEADPDILIISTFNGYHYQKQRDLIDGLLALGIPTIMVSTATPYDLMAFPEVEVYFALYSNRAMALQIAAETIFGLGEPLGRLPVTLSEEYCYGYRGYQVRGKR
jgi:beta-N-acetylhexosaminidase